ncbi:hypothetical protein RRG08_060132 [Elysia crispata]|uniref:Uncharacterized protein n=1 Tax=Elysia crispata TaxID=231223 RepID=A0AAE0ZZ41_9GAST|nr:hypothetical protein RRG08_060132 [Elysia crispata]
MSPGPTSLVLPVLLCDCLTTYTLCVVLVVFTNCNFCIRLKFQFQAMTHADDKRPNIQLLYTVEKLAILHSQTVKGFNTLVDGDEIASIKKLTYEG